MTPRGAPVTGGRRWSRGALVLALAVTAVLLPQLLRAQGIECDGTAGEREVRSLEFRGNRAFPSRELELRVSTTSSDFLQRRLHAFGTRRCLDSDALRLDVGRLRVFYQRHGYYGATVDTAVTAAGDSDGVNVAFLIDEGQPVLIDSLRISGLDSAVRTIVDTSELALRKGIPFDRTKLQATIDTIKSRLRNNGYPRADVAASYTVDTTAHHARVGLTVLPGTRAHIGQIRVFSEPLPGKEASRLGTPTVLRLSSVRTGDLYRDRDVVDAQRVLYQSDLFRSVEVRLAPDSAQPPGDSLVTLDILVRENYLRQVDTEPGWSVLDCFKDRTRYVDKSFLGEARRLELTAQVSKVGFGTPTRFGNGNLCAPAIREDTFSAKLNYFTSASLRLPTLFGFRASPTFSVYSERRGEYQAFLRTTLVGGEASFSRDVARDLPLRLAYSLEFGRTEAPPALLCALFSFCDAESRAFITDQNRRLAVASAHVERIRTDNPFVPRAGTVLRLDVRTSLRELGSDPKLEFLKGLSDASYYKALGAGATFAVRLRLGTVLGRTLSFTDSTGFIPPEERLYAGGAGSVRGFQQNALGDLIYIAETAPSVVQGPGDTVFVRLGPTADSQGVRRVVPVGGNSLIVANFELRLRSRFFPELLQYTVFVDGGDVWSRQTNIGQRSHAASKLFLNGLKWTPGVGVRVFTPVGPFQANVGYNPFPQPAGAIYFDASAAPPPGLAPLSLYCVTPGNVIPAVPNGSGSFEQVPGVTCDPFTPPRKTTFLSRLTFTFSIGPDF
jgi:outer membrane protein insertion porin family/translocation and assembly module TamA